MSEGGDVISELKIPCRYPSDREGVGIINIHTAEVIYYVI